MKGLVFSVCSVWSEAALAGAVNGSCPPNPVPSSICCQAPWVNSGTENFFFTKPHLFYIHHSQRPQKRHFLASRKPTRTINRMCLTCSPSHVFFPLLDFNTAFVWRIQKYLTGLNQVLNHVSCSLETWPGLYLVFCNADSAVKNQDEFLTT